MDDTPSPGRAGRPTPDRQSSGAESSIDLVRRARDGDRGALDQLFRRYVPRLRRWATGRLPARSRDLLDTDDIVQETLLKTFRKVDSFVPRRDGALQAYMRQALFNRIRDEVRVARRRPATEVVAEVADAAASPLEQAIGREALELYERALGRLAPADREAIVARVEMSFSYGQVALALGKSTADAARMAVSRAIVRLAREMTHGGA